MPSMWGWLQVLSVIFSQNKCTAEFLWYMLHPVFYLSYSYTFYNIKLYIFSFTWTCYITGCHLWVGFSWRLLNLVNGKNTSFAVISFPMYDSVYLFTTHLRIAFKMINCLRFFHDLLWISYTVAHQQTQIHKN